MSYENSRVYEVPFISAAVAPNFPSITPISNVSHIPNLSIPTLLDPYLINKSVVPIVPNHPPVHDRLNLGLPENLYETLNSNCNDSNLMSGDDMVSTCCHCKRPNIMLEIEWGKSKKKLKAYQELIDYLKKQINFHKIIPVTNQSSPLPPPVQAALVCPPEMFNNLKSNLSVNAQEFRPIQNQKSNPNMEETHNVNKEVFSNHGMRNEESKLRLQNESLEINDSVLRESGLDSGVLDSGASDSGIIDPVNADPAAERYINNDETEINCNTYNSIESENNSKENNTKRPKKKSKQKQKPENGSFENLLCNKINDRECLNQGHKIKEEFSSIKNPENSIPYHVGKPNKINGNQERPNARKAPMDKRMNGRGGPRSEPPIRSKVSKSNDRQEMNSTNSLNFSVPRRNLDFVVQEIEGDLFAVGDEYSLAHCVAEDFRMGAGIAIHFKKRFLRVGELLDQRKTVGEVAVLKHENRYIFYLVTKQLSNNKPTIDDAAQAIRALKNECLERNVKKLAMPRIGSGLDKLPWPRVKKLLYEEFSGSGVEVLVYYPKEDEETADPAPIKKVKSPQVVREEYPLKMIDADGTAFVVYGTQDGYMDKSCESLNEKYPFKKEYLKRCSQHNPGDIMEIVCSKSVYLYVFIIRENPSAPFSFQNLESCAGKLNKILEELKCNCYIGLEWVDDEDALTNEKIVNVFRSRCSHRIPIYLCNVKRNQTNSYSPMNLNNDSTKSFSSNGKRS